MSNARRLLIKLLKDKLDNQIKVLNNKYQELDYLNATIEKLKQDIIKEREFISKNEALSFIDHSAFFSNMLNTQDHINKQVTEVNKQIYAIQEGLIDIFIEIKQIEHLQNISDKKIKKSEDIKEQKELDNIGRIIYQGK